MWDARMGGKKHPRLATHKALPTVLCSSPETPSESYVSSPILISNMASVSQVLTEKAARPSGGTLQRSSHCLMYTSQMRVQVDDNDSHFASVKSVSLNMK